MLSFSIPVGAETKSESDRNKGYRDGYQWAEITGAIQGQRDRINDRKSNWERAYSDVESELGKKYNLDDTSFNYRRGFLEGYEEGFRQSYENAYKNVIDERKKTATEMGKTHGNFFGRLIGGNYASNDYYNKRTSDWRRHLPSESTIRLEFNLGNDTLEYAEAFLQGYKAGFEEEYIYMYRVNNYESEKITREDGLDHGFVIGETTGRAYAMVDYITRVPNNWEMAFNKFEKAESLFNRYGLLRENSQYRLGFTNGFKDGFKNGYTTLYQNFNKDMAQQNINYKQVTMIGETIEYQDSILHFIQGKQSKETRVVVYIDIPPAAIYEDTYVSLQKIDTSLSMNHLSYRPVTHAYEIKVINNNHSVQLQKPIHITFQYVGSHRGGIYEWKNNQWQYRYSVLDGGKISTEISPSIYSGGRYAVFIDENYIELSDIYTHWARQELYTFIRRGYISGYSDGTFRPDNNISTDEFLLLLNRFNKNSDINVVNRSKNITYEEIEKIVRQVSRDSQFQWEQIAEKMFYEKYTRSNSRLSKNNLITRAEVIYMLYQLQESGKL